MRVQDTRSFLGFATPVAQPADAREAAWMRAFATTRLALLGLAFAGLPLALALSPRSAAAAVPAFLAVMSAATAGLVGLRYRTGVQALALSILGLLPLVLALASGGAPLAMVMLAGAAVVLEALAAPAAYWRSRLLMAVVAGVLCSLAVTAAVAAATVPAPAALVAVSGLAIAPIAVLILTIADVQRVLQQQEETARHATRRDAALLAAADLALLVVDKGAGVAEMTPAASTLLGCPPADLLGRGLVDQVLIADRPAFLKAISDALNDGKESRLSLRLAVGQHRRDARSAPRFTGFDAFVRPVSGSEGQVALRLQPAAAGVDASRGSERTQLFATLSHEVRTPMNAILGFAEILANPSVQPADERQVREYATIIHRAAKDAFGVTQALVDLLRVESPDFELQAEFVDVRSMAAKMIAALSDRPDGSQGISTLEAAPDLAEFNVDPRAIRMLLSNLIDGFANAGGRDARLTCGLSCSPHGLLVTVTCDCASTVPNRHAHAAYLGVVSALVRRLAGLMGASLDLSTEGPRFAATLLVPETVAVAPLARPSVPDVHVRSLSFRKSA
jgi:cell cycle sensor histidine kinase DivJ